MLTNYASMNILVCVFTIYQCYEIPFAKQMSLPLYSPKFWHFTLYEVALTMY